MATQRPPRPWFSLATMTRPAAPAQAPAPAPAPPPPRRPPAPTPAPQPTLLQPPPPPPVPSLRPPVALPQPALPQEPTTAAPRPQPPAAASPPATTPPSPLTPTLLRLPIASPSFATPTTPRSPAMTGVPLPAASSPSPPSLAILNPESPIIKPSSPGLQKATTETSTTRPAVVSSSYSSLPPSPKPKVSVPSPLPTSPTPKTLFSASSPPPPAPVPNAATITTASPAPPPASPAPISTASEHAANPISSPKKVKPLEKTPPQSPIVKPLSHPPSPLTLPPAQLKADNDHLESIPPEAEQKTVLMQETEAKSKIALKTSIGNPKNSHGEIHEGYNVAQHGKRELKKDNGIYKKNSDFSEEFGIRVVTLAGENKGAVMELSPASRNRYGFNGHKLASNHDEANGEGRFQMKDHKHDEAMKMQTAQQQPMDAFVNSNVQGVNNSILYNCAYKNSDPGVHLSVSRKANGGVRGLHHQDSGHHD